MWNRRRVRILILIPALFFCVTAFAQHTYSRDHHVFHRLSGPKQGKHTVSNSGHVPNSNVKAPSKTKLPPV
jgi:hypothetical protein